MTHDATHDELRLLRWRPRPPADAADPGPDPVQMGALLDDIGALRLSLSVDMDVLASAVELRAYDVAAEVVDGDRADLAAFRDRASARLSSVAGTPAPPAPVRRGVVRVLRAALPAAPALAAAAALVGVLAGLAPGPRTATPDSFGPASAGFAELFGLQDASTTASGQDAAAALREELVRVMALAMHDPQAAARALAPLSARVEQVEDEGERAALRDALAEVARLLAALDARLELGTVTAAVDDAVTAVGGAEAAAGLGGSPAAGPVRAPSATPSPEPSESGPEEESGGGTTGSPEPEPEPTPSPTPEAGVPDVLQGGAANGSTGVLPAPGAASQLGG